MIYCVYDPRWIHLFIEYLESIAKYFPLQFVTSLDTIKLVDTDVIWLATYSLSSVKPIHEKYPDITYLLNFEQTSAPDNVKKLNAYPKTLKMIDYSLRNIMNYPRDNYYYIPYMVNTDEIVEFDKTKGFIILGTPCKRRTEIINELNATSFIAFGKQRDDNLFRHKILVNIHQYEDYNVLEELRINRCVYNKMIVITENSGNIDYYDLKDYIIECEYKDIVKVAKDVLENYDYYYKKLFKNFDIIQHSINRKAIADKTIINN